VSSPKFPEPPPSATPTPIAEVDALLQKLAAKKGEWVQTPIPRRIELLRACIEATVAGASDWVVDAARAKGIDPASPRSGEEWLGGPMTVARNMRLLVETLEAGGTPRVPQVTTRSDGQKVARVFPANTFDKLMFTGITADVWIEPGHDATNGKLYREKAAGHAGAGKVALVLGAGNVASIGPMDALYKLFAEDEVVIVKTNPVNAYLGRHWERAMKPLIDAGFLAIVHGGADVGSHLTNHSLVETIHITGSDRTHDAIVWGADPDEQARRKAANEPLNNRPISSELGCVTPVLIVPGPWSESDIDFQARHVASMITNNASFNCNAAKVIVVAKGWALKDRFIAAVHAKLASIPPRKAYYPGAQQRYDGFLSHYPGAKPLSERANDVVPWTVIPDVAADGSEYALTNEAFCGVVAEVELDASDAAEFLAKAVPFANDDCWGTLSMMMLVHPATEKQYAAELDRAIAGLRYGGIGVNVWAGVIYGLCTPPWGAFPGHPLSDIRSGRGWVHNTYLLDHPQKTVLRAPFRINPTPAWFADHKTQQKLGEALVAFEVNPGWMKLPRVIGAALGG
jgi:acyl-CoA reductase-like NAD-dependent aldehyde dehydrogenase